jgi:hypothetical protein
MTIHNGYVPHASAGGLVASEDVTLTDLTLTAFDGEGNVIFNEELGSLEEGGERRLEAPEGGSGQRVRLSFVDPFGNQRYVERGEWLTEYETPPFLHSPVKS